MSGVSSFAGSILPNVFLVFKRFPLAVLTAAFLTFLMVFFDKLSIFNTNLYLGLITLFFIFVGSVLVMEKRQENILYGFIISLVTGSFCVGLFYFADFIGLHRVMLTVATLLGASSVAYIFSPKKNRAYWQFNHEFWFTFVIAIIGGMIIGVLFSALFGVYGALFNSRIPSDVYKTIFQVSTFLITPVFWLSMVPQDFDAEVEETIPTELTSKVTALFVKYVFVPFFFMFVLLFHGLAVKVGVSGVFPKGQIGWYGLAVIVLGIGTYLMAFPTRHIGGALVKFFHKYWFLFLIIPMILLFVAHSIRVTEYGMTPKRYFLYSFFFWSLVLVLYGLYVEFKNREFDLRVIIFLATLILGVSSFGPWGAETVSIFSQKQKLITLLQDADVLEGGVIKQSIKASKINDPKSKRKIRNLLRFFRRGQRADSLRELLPEAVRPPKGSNLNYLKRRKSSWNNPIIALIDKQLGFRRHIGTKAKMSRRYFYTATPNLLTIPSKGSVLGPITLSKRNSNEDYERKMLIINDGSTIPLVIKVNAKELIVFLSAKGAPENERQRLGAFAIDEIYKSASEIETSKSKKTRYKGKSALVIDGVENSAHKMRLFVTSFNYAVSPTTGYYESFSYLKFSLFIEDGSKIFAK